MYKTNQMLHQEISDLTAEIARLNGLLLDYKYAEANYTLTTTQLEGEIKLLKEKNLQESCIRWEMEKRFKLLQEFNDYLKEKTKVYDNRTSNGTSDEVAEPVPF